MKTHFAEESLNQACSGSGLVDEVARLSDNLEKSELQIAALNRVLELMREAAGERFVSSPAPEQALSA